MPVGWLPGEEHETPTEQQVTPRRGIGVLVEQGLQDLVESQTHFLLPGLQSRAAPAVTVTRSHDH